MASRITMNISLTPELEKFIADKVASGKYLSSSEVVREALRLLQDRDAVREARLEEFRKQVAAEAEQVERDTH